MPTTILPKGAGPGGNERGTQYGNLWMKPLRPPLRPEQLAGPFFASTMGEAIVHLSGALDENGAAIHPDTLLPPSSTRTADIAPWMDDSVRFFSNLLCFLTFWPAFSTTETLPLWLFAEAVPLLHFLAPKYFQQCLSRPFIRHPLARSQVAFH